MIVISIQLFIRGRSSYAEDKLSLIVWYSMVADLLINADCLRTAGWANVRIQMSNVLQIDIANLNLMHVQHL